MATITPALTITANDSSHATPGPLSFALSLNQSKAISGLTKVETKIMDITAGSESAATHTVFDKDAFVSSGAQTDQDGGYVYLRNMLADNSPVDRLHDVLIGFGGAKDLDGDGESVRLMTLRPGEFAFFPWDMTEDLVCDIKETNDAALEAWLFVKTTTA